MAMNGNTLGDAIKSAVDGLGDPTDRTALFRAIGNAITDHIANNAAVAVTVASVTLVTAGVASSGPGTGSGTIT
ncbi:hypothetical protein LCGC14_3037890 [marine sediment metagenome]|uniref:Uncharacterized protein n=1 Tax=marine sediment metagenome TaxID=412755 RepID=A0A0F8XDQ5_9ZZZZ